MRRNNVRSEVRAPHILTREYQEANVSIWGEVLFALELVLLHAAPVYYGLGTPHGDGSAVVLIPGFHRNAPATRPPLCSRLFHRPSAPAPVAVPDAPGASTATSSA